MYLWYFLSGNPPKKNKKKWFGNPKTKIDLIFFISQLNHVGYVGENTLHIKQNSNNNNP